MTDALIHALVIDASGVPRALDAEAVSRWQPEQGVLWVHFDANAPFTLDWLKGKAGLPELVPEALVATETRPRSTAFGDGLLIVMRGVNLNPGADPEDMVSLRLWVDEHRIISTRRRQLLSIGDAVNSLEQRPASGTPDILLRIIERLVDRVNNVVDQLEDQAADLENSVLTEPTQVMRARLSELRREAIAMRRYLSPQREALGRLYSERQSWFQEPDRLRVRELHDRMVRLVEDIDTVRERTTVVHEELVSQLSDQLNKRMYLLSITAALFLPLGFLTGLLGINVGGIPGAENPYAFWIFAGMLAALLSAQILYFVRNRWF